MNVHAGGRSAVALPGRCVWRWDWEDVSLFCDSTPLLGGVECWEHPIARVQASPDPDVVPDSEPVRFGPVQVPAPEVTL